MCGCKYLHPHNNALPLLHHNPQGVRRQRYLQFAIGFARFDFVQPVAVGVEESGAAQRGVLDGDGGLRVGRAVGKSACRDDFVALEARVAILEGALFFLPARGAHRGADLQQHLR